MNKWYGVEDVVRMSRLSERTVRNYLSMGLLEGEKVDGAWRFTAEQFEAFLRQEMVSQSVRAKANSIVYDFLLVEKRREGAACLILDLRSGGSDGSGPAPAGGGWEQRPGAAVQLPIPGSQRLCPGDPGGISRPGGLSGR